eukprot:UN04740
MIHNREAFRDVFFDNKKFDPSLPPSRDLCTFLNTSVKTLVMTRSEKIARPDRTALVLSTGPDRFFTHKIVMKQENK